MDGNPPKKITFDSQVFDLAFHPQNEIVAAGLLTGEVYCYKYSVENENEFKYKLTEHKKSCRSLEFSLDGNKLYTASLDQSIIEYDATTGKKLYINADAHDSPINKILCLNENVMASGDDDGIVKLWDVRKNNAIMQWQENEDYISDMKFVPEKRNLLVSGADGYFSVFDIRKKDVYARSDNLDDELLSITLVKNKSKVVVGSQEGILNIFTYGDWGDVSDRFPGHPQSIDALCTIDENTICTGSSDGLIRVISILPNKLVGVIGSHDDYPIEQLKLTHDGKFMGSCSHDNTIKFWDIDYFFNDDEDDEDDEDNYEFSGFAGGSDNDEGDDDDENEDEEDEENEENEDGEGKKKDKGKRKLEDDEEDDDDDDDDDDDSDDDSSKKKKKKSKKAKRGIGGSVKATNSFFAGLD